MSPFNLDLRMVLFLCTCRGVSSAQWAEHSLKDGSVLSVCENGSLALPWRVAREQGETIAAVKWNYRGQSSEVVALVVHGQLQVLPTYSGRVTLTANGELVLSHVTSGDKGDYSIEMTITGGNAGSTSLRSTVSVVVNSTRLLTGAVLRVREKAVPDMRNGTSRGWRLALACGNFTFDDHDTPPLAVTWITPSGESRASDGYSRGEFLLMTSQPVPPGTYTCKLQKSFVSRGCVKGTTPDLEAAILVDDVTSRLALLEAENEALRARMSRVLADTQGKLLQLENYLANEETRRVSFHATGLRSTGPKDGQVMVPQHVFHNLGGGYDKNTGKFTAPYNGTYCFMTSFFGSDLPNGTKYMHVHLMANNQEVVRAWTDFDRDGSYDAGSLQAVVPLTTGQEAWLQASGDKNEMYWHRLANTFSGFLVSYDP